MINERAKRCLFAVLWTWKHGYINNSKQFAFSNINVSNIQQCLKVQRYMNLVGMWSNLQRCPLGFTWFDHVTNQVHVPANFLIFYYFLHNIPRSTSNVYDVWIYSEVLFCDLLILTLHCYLIYTIANRKIKTTKTPNTLEKTSIWSCRF